MAQFAIAEKQQKIIVQQDMQLKHLQMQQRITQRQLMEMELKSNHSRKFSGSSQASSAPPRGPKTPPRTQSHQPIEKVEDEVDEDEEADWLYDNMSSTLGPQVSSLIGICASTIPKPSKLNETQPHTHTNTHQHKNTET